MNKLRHRILSVLLAAVIAGSSCCPSVYAQFGSYAELSGGAVPEQTGNSRLTPRTAAAPTSAARTAPVWN